MRKASYLYTVLTVRCYVLQAERRTSPSPKTIIPQHQNQQAQR